MTDIFILCLDRDGNVNRLQSLDELEAKFGDGKTFLAENAWEELETWILAGLASAPDWNWKAVRAEVEGKKTYVEPLVGRRNSAYAPGVGRKLLGDEVSCRLDAIRQKCPEDFEALARRLEVTVQLG